MNKVFHKRRIVATASVLIFIMVIGALFSFTDIFSRNDASEPPDEDVGIPDIYSLISENLVLENPREIIIETPRETTTGNHESISNNLLELRDILNTYFEKESFQNIYAFLDERGLIINLQSSEIFVDDSYDINIDGINILEYISRQLSYYSFERISIEHHTDIFEVLLTLYDPSHNIDFFDYNSNKSIYSIFLDYLGFGSVGFGYFSYGAAIPITTNSTREGRLLNNRVEIVIEHHFDIAFLEMHSANPRESVPGINTQVETVIGKLIGCWQTKWVDGKGDENFYEISFYNDFMFSIRYGEKDSESVTEFRGRYSLDLHSDRIRLHDHDYSVLVIFLFIRENLLLSFEGAEPFVFSRVVSQESLDS